MSESLAWPLLEAARDQVHVATDWGYLHLQLGLPKGWERGREEIEQGRRWAEKGGNRTWFGNVGIC